MKQGNREIRKVNHEIFVFLNYKTLISEYPCSLFYDLKMGRQFAANNLEMHVITLMVHFLLQQDVWAGVQ